MVAKVEQQVTRIKERRVDRSHPRHSRARVDGAGPDVDVMDDEDRDEDDDDEPGI